MVSFIQHLVIGLGVLYILMWLMRMLEIEGFSRHVIEIMIWAGFLLFVAYGLFMPLL